MIKISLSIAFIVSTCLWMIPAVVYAQTGSLEGVVVETETGEPLPGANIYIEELQQGTSTDTNGEFAISGIENGIYTVTVSFIGFEELTEEVEIEGETTVEFALQISAAELDEVIVTGYGIRQRSQITGAISSVQGEEFRARPIQTPDQALQGRASGFRMVSTSGQPGGDSYIRIRGIGSITAGTQPLFIVDGVRLEPSYQATQASMNILQSINPANIEHIEVLKDASATAIYGADGANGVVLITTRRGREGPTQFSASMQFGVAEQPFTYDMMNGPEFVTAMQEAYANRYEDLGLDPEEGRQTAIATFGHPDDVGTYDWYGAMLQRGIQQRYDVSAQGGTDATQFFISGGITDEEGTILNNTYSRMNLMANINHQATERLRFDLNTNLSRSKATGLADHDGDTGGSNWVNSPFHGGVTTRVTTPIYNEDGSYNQDPNGLAGVMYNNVQVLNEEERSSRRVSIIGSLSATYNILDNLSFRSRWALDYRIDRDHRFNSPTIDRYAEYGGSVYDRTREVTSWNTDQVVEYFDTFREIHNVNALFGFEYQHMYRDQHFATGEQLPNHLFRTIDATALNADMGATFAEFKKAGIFTRAEYNYDHRFYVSASVRYDGSSRFGADNRYGFFYSGSLAWDLAGETFMSGAHFISELRPRISYGTTGNSDIGYYASLPFFGTGLTGGEGSGDSGSSYGGETGVRPTQLGNPALTWEVAKSMDIGVDWSLFEGRAYGSFGIFRTDNEELLLDRSLPNHSGFTYVSDNIGTVRNEGFELEAGAVLVQTGRFNWTSDFNLTYERSEILELAEGQESIGNTIRVGHPREIRWGAAFAGVNPANGRPMWYDENNELTYSVTDADLRPIGSQLPDYYGGFNNRFNYGPVTLGVLFHYEYGKDLYNVQHDQFMMTPHRGRTLSTEMFNAWQQPGDMTGVPRMYSEAAFPGTSPITTFDTRHMQDGSFIRLKNVSVQYQLPPQWTEAINLSGVSIFFQAENLVTWTAYDGPDPEVIAQSQTNYPQPRTFMGGINIDF